MKIFTIGFTKRTAEDFFGSLHASGVSKIVDVRLRANSQLSGFAKVPDLPYFLRKICGIEYEMQPLLAPTADLLDAYKSKRMTWDGYASKYVELIEGRGASRMDVASLDGVCFLCSEHLPHKCHRRVAAEYLRSVFDGDFEIVHL
ncbi:DUF488 family protein, N3 subclade [Stenotrophomonas muris]|uniref:DUF488 family protein, N3 subclade n=1 Tax=Stenotrophomonas muris TaxID=2963283 RepID=UPI0009ADBE90